MGQEENRRELARRPRVLVTRPAGQAEELAERLRRHDLEVLVCPLVRIEPLADDPIDAAAYDRVVVTSPNGARELVRRLVSPPRWLAAIGPGTADALRHEGLEPDLVPAAATQEGLLAEIPRPPGRVLVAAAEGARRLLADELGADFLPLYRTIELRPERVPDADLVVLASPSAARAFAATGTRLPAVTIGPQTTATALAAGLDVAAEAETHDLDGLVTATVAACASVSFERLDAC